MSAPTTDMNTDQPILEELNRRKSVRAFSPKEIEPAKLDALWAAARWAPSSANKQEWHYYAVTGPAREKFREVLSPGNLWALKAPLLLAVARDASIEDKIETREYGAYNVALSVMCLVIEAEHQGLRAHQMAGFKGEPLRQVLKLAPNELPVVVVAVGYEGDETKLDEATREKEKRPRTRKPVAEVVTMVDEIR